MTRKRESALCASCATACTYNSHSVCLRIPAAGRTGGIGQNNRDTLRMRVQMRALSLDGASTAHAARGCKWVRRRPSIDRKSEGKEGTCVRSGSVFQAYLLIDFTLGLLFYPSQFTCSLGMCTMLVPSESTSTRLLGVYVGRDEECRSFDICRAFNNGLCKEFGGWPSMKNVYQRGQNPPPKIWGGLDNVWLHTTYSNGLSWRGVDITITGSYGFSGLPRRTRSSRTRRWLSCARGVADPFLRASDISLTVRSLLCTRIYYPSMYQSQEDPESREKSSKLQNWESTGIRPTYARGHISESTTRSLKRKAIQYHNNLSKQDALIETQNKRLRTAHDAKIKAEQQLNILQSQPGSQVHLERAYKAVDRASDGKHGGLGAAQCPGCMAFAPVQRLQPDAHCPSHLPDGADGKRREPWCSSLSRHAGSQLSGTPVTVALVEPESESTSAY
ncbi:hypothetical protein B0H13DRAFT_1910713 [Mycena leptocephala]|nr:hypothetical protein B0H13DRAFT_1910713 [Mycena leptocephala]